MRSRRFRPVRAIVLVTVVAFAAGLLPAAPALAPTTEVSGHARAQGVDVDAEVSGIPAGAHVDLTRSESEMDSDGIGPGTNVAAGSAIPARVVADPLANATFADSSTTAPPPSTDTDGVPSVSVPTLLSATALASGSAADTTPRSANSARVGEATVTITPVRLDVSTVFGTAETKRAGLPGSDTALSTANSHVAVATVKVGLTTVTVKGATANADAQATGIAPGNPGGSTAGSSCQVLELKINLTTILNPPCNASSNRNVAGVLRIKFGENKSASASADSASASVDAITIQILTSSQTIVLASAEAGAARAGAAPAPICPTSGGPTASGSAIGDVVRINDGLGLTQTDVSLSEAAIDEAGVNGTGKSATSDAWPLRVLAPSPPDPDAIATLEVADSHATAPPNQTDSDSVPDLNTSLFKASVLESHAAASAGADLSNPAASGDATVQSADVGPVATIRVTNSTAFSTASSDTDDTRTLSKAEAGVEALSATIAGLVVTADVLKSSATATATGVPGGATTATSFEVLTVKVDGITVATNPPAGTTITLLGVLRLSFGVTSESVSADGTMADASMTALVLEDLILDDRIAIAHSEAHARFPVPGADGAISKNVDIHFDDPPTFGDDGGTAAPHQKIRYLICVANTGTVQLTNVHVTDTLDANLTIVELPSGCTAAGQAVTCGPFSIDPGKTLEISMLVEVRSTTALGVVIGNAATFTSDQLPPGTSNTVITNVGIVPDQPALFPTMGSVAFDPATRILTLETFEHNSAGAGDAFDVIIDKITTNPPSVILLTPLPIELGDIAAGTSKAFITEYFIPEGVGSFRVDFRELGFDAPAGTPGRHRYAFD